MRSIKRLRTLPMVAANVVEPPKQVPVVYATYDDYHLRTLSLEELIDPVSRWFPSVQTLNAEKAVYMSDVNGWYALAKNNEPPVGSFALIRKAHKTSWIGYYYIVESLRGTSLAPKLLTNHMEPNNRTNTVKFTLQCFPTLEKLYKRYGFKTDFYDSINRAEIEVFSKPESEPPLHFTPTRLKAIYHYDKKIQKGLDRSPFLLHWLSKPQTETLVALDPEENVVGYSVLNKFYFESKEIGNHHYRIAPLYADSPEIAQQLLTASLSAAPTPSVFFDTDGSNPLASEILTKVGIFKPIAPLSRMSKTLANCPEPDNYYDNSKVYGFTDYGTGP